MKGISGIIATILLVLIAIALVGTAYVFFSGMIGGRTSKPISIAASDGNTVVISNDGTEAISSGEIKIFVNGQEATILNPQAIQPHESAALKFLSTQFGSVKLTIVSPSNSVNYPVVINPIKILVIENPNNGGNSWISKLDSLGFIVVSDISVTTKAQVDSYSPYIVACFATAWGCSKVSLFNQLYDAGYSVFTEGNDNANAIYPTVSSVWTGANAPTIYSQGTHPIAQGWASAPGSGGDGRYGPTAINPSAVSIAKDTVNNYFEGIYLEEPGKGRWYHHQPNSLAPDRLIQNAVYYLAKRI